MRVFTRSIVAEWKDFERFQEGVDAPPRLRWPAALCRAESELCDSDRADREVVRASLLKASKNLRHALDRIDAGIRIEEIDQRSRSARAGPPGSADGASKSAGTPFQLPQYPFGKDCRFFASRMTLLPERRMLTSSPSNRNSFGSRTD